VYNWWLTITRAASAGAYSPMGQALYSNAVWNLFPDQDNTSWMKYTKIYGNWLMRNWSRKPLPGAGKGFFTIDISEVVNDVVTDREKGDGKGWFDMGPEKDLSGFDFNKKTINGIPVRFAKKNGVASFIKFNKLKKEQAKIKINRKLGSLIVLQAANIDAGDYKGYERFRNRKNYKDPLRGLPIAEFTVRYSDGTDAKFYARLGWNLSRWNYDPMFYWDVFAKYVLDARSLAEGKTKHAVDKNLPDDIALYQYEWPNPNPSKTVQSVTVNGLGKYVSYGILALTARNSGK
jgi:hypothetical protein